MTDAEIRRLLEATTPGPWSRVTRARADQPPLVVRPPSGAPDDDGDLVARALRQEDARLLAAAPELARLLLEAREERDAYHAAVHAAQEYTQHVEFAQRWCNDSTLWADNVEIGPKMERLEQVIWSVDCKPPPSSDSGRSEP